MQFLDLPVHADCFTAPADLYLLSHYHRDHMEGLRRGWAGGRLLCSPTTANLLAVLEGLPRERMVTIEPGQTIHFAIKRADLAVTALDANHCPGALIFILECGGRRIVYTGDFRINAGIRSQKARLAGAEVLYVDGTYASPEFSFPTQEKSVAMVVDGVKRNRDKEVLLAVYTIGKNRIIEALFAEFGKPVYVTKDKLRAYEAMGCGNLVTAERRRALLSAYSRAYFDRYFRWHNGRTPHNTLVIYPSGQPLDPPGRAGFLHVPYSEHCDWAEYREFVEMVGARTVVNT